MFFAILGLMLSRKKINSQLKFYSSLIGIFIFIYFLFSQPLIIKQKEFGIDTSGNLINAKEIWDFRNYTPKTIPDELFKTIDSKKKKLTDFKGKTIYVSFWATWCGPCLAEKTKLDSLKKKFNDDSNIIFIDISIDTDKDSWKLYLNNKRPKGVQLISENINRTSRNFSITSIPKHIIVNNNLYYKSLRFIPAAEKYLKNGNLMEKWIMSKQLVIERKE
ncbi:TlpA family protein disulfide reductase [Tenacibaculum sp. MAR_2009_124]|uniref:TlpA family protein disulfide reductase n=1 Tax=Tenacibaculum sp. MAR_2009_124 TaxID=1250059 RepID=UPI0015A28695|nr:TlpA disulfide reductase family protein [Tenacibaculum sp. MAR_2009_124]